MPRSNAFTRGSKDHSYPDALSAAEWKAIAERREMVRRADGTPPEPSGEAKAIARRRRRQDASATNGELASPSMPAPLSATYSDTWRDDCVGLAISGGGIRSAIFSLGFMQALASGSTPLLRFVDYLSTVSGGSFIGAYLGRHYLRGGEFAAWEREGEVASQPASLVKRVEEMLSYCGSHSVHWLRENGRYLAPRGGGDVWVAAAGGIRDWLSVQVYIGVFLLACFFGLHALESGLGSVPGMAAIVSPPEVVAGPASHGDRVNGEIDAARPVARDSAPGNLFWRTLNKMKRIWQVTGLPLFGVLAVFIAFLILYWVLVYAAWALPKRAPRNGLPEEAMKARVRRDMTEVTSYLLVLGVFLAAYRIIDIAGFELRQDLKGVLASAGAAMLAVFAVGSRASAAAALFKTEGKGPRVDILGALVLGAGMLLFVNSLILLSAFSYWFADRVAGFEIFSGVPRWQVLLVLAGVCIAISLLWNRMTGFVNLTTLHALYTARLTRAFLGASNPKRWRAKDKGVTAPLESDDIQMVKYRPHKQGGAFHIINSTLNETVSGESQLEFRDRKGLPFAISALGMSVGVSHHALVEEVIDPLRMKVTTLREYEDDAFELIPRKAIEAEGLSLGSWVGISGAAVSTGMGSVGSLGLSMVLAFFNIRLGYWWDSAIKPSDRNNTTVYTRSSSGLHFVSKVFSWLFEGQSYLFSEYLGRFYGPGRRFWNLTDGGHFENTGVYELIRRQLPLIVCLDNGADPDYQFADLANLVRRARMDFEAEIDFVSVKAQDEEAEIEKEKWDRVPKDLRRPLKERIEEMVEAGNGFFKSIEDLRRPARESTSAGHASVGLIRYTRTEKLGVLLWIKPTLTGDEDQDLVEYHRCNAAFPAEDTADQFFDEAQWESYRNLGMHIGGHVVKGLDGRIRNLLEAVRPDLRR